MCGKFPRNSKIEATGKHQWDHKLTNQKWAKYCVGIAV